MKKKYLTGSEVKLLVEQMAKRIVARNDRPGRIRVYGVPRGGVPVALALDAWLHMEIVDHPEDATIIVDDIVDSGRTREIYSQYGVPFFALIGDEAAKDPDVWVVFPWEVQQRDGRTDEEPRDEGIQENVVRILQYVGEDANREGLLDTPKRVEKAWGQWTEGYKQDPAEILKVFEDGGENYDEMVIVKDIPIYSKCEHHLADIFGTVTIAYIPDGKIVGLSKLSRLANCFARRLQVQERLTNQIADALVEHLAPKGVGVLMRARHMCMESRGICQQGHHTITSALRGAVKEQADTRAEFMSLAST